MPSKISNSSTVTSHHHPCSLRVFMSCRVYPIVCVILVLLDVVTTFERRSGELFFLFPFVTLSSGVKNLIGKTTLYSSLPFPALISSPQSRKGMFVLIVDPEHPNSLKSHYVRRVWRLSSFTCLADHIAAFDFSRGSRPMEGVISLYSWKEEERLICSSNGNVVLQSSPLSKHDIPDECLWKRHFMRKHRKTRSMMEQDDRIMAKLGLRSAKRAFMRSLFLSRVKRSKKVAENPYRMGPRNRRAALDIREARYESKEIPGSFLTVSEEGVISIDKVKKDGNRFVHWKRRHRHHKRRKGDKSVTGGHQKD